MNPLFLFFFLVFTVSATVNESDVFSIDRLINWESGHLGAVCQRTGGEYICNGNGVCSCYRKTDQSYWECAEDRSVWKCQKSGCICYKKEPSAVTCMRDRKVQRCFVLTRKFCYCENPFRRP